MGCDSCDGCGTFDGIAWLGSDSCDCFGTYCARDGFGTGDGYGTFDDGTAAITLDSAEGSAKGSGATKTAAWTAATKIDRCRQQRLGFV